MQLYQNLNYLMENYRTFLNISYDSVENVYQILDWDNLTDWFSLWSRENFYYFVLIHLENENHINILPYGYTSYQKHLFIKDKNKKYYRIACKTSKETYWFVSYIGKCDDSFCESKPFDYVVVEKNKNIYYINHKEIMNYFIEQIEL